MYMSVRTPVNVSSCDFARDLAGGRPFDVVRKIRLSHSSVGLENLRINILKGCTCQLRSFVFVLDNRKN